MQKKQLNQEITMNNATVNNLGFWETDVVEPSDILELDDWKLTLPFDGEDSGSSPDEINESDLSNNYESDFFYANDDGGVVFYVPSNADDFEFASFGDAPRTELREMLRAGDTSIPTIPTSDRPSNENNWVFGSASPDAENTPGGVNGDLEATLSVDRVAEFSDSASGAGRVIIGQIHSGIIGGGGGEVPLALTYEKLPGEDLGTIVLRAEDSDNNDFDRYDFFEDSGNGSDGIALGERFSYNIQTEGNEATITLSRDRGPDLTHTVDYTGKGFDASDQYLYLRAGAYTQDTTNVEGDFSQATFYQLDNTHDASGSGSKASTPMVDDDSDEIENEQTQPDLISSQETFQETLSGTLGVQTIYDFDDVLNSTENTKNQDIIQNFEAGLDLIDLSDLGFTGLDADGGNTEVGEIRLTHSSATDRTYLRSDQSEFEAYIEGGDYTSLSDDHFLFSENVGNML